MDKAEYWILNSVATSAFPINALATQDEVAFTLNKKWHELTLGKLADTLFRLFCIGDLDAERISSQASFDTLRLTRQEIAEALTFSPRRQQIPDTYLPVDDIYYRLTPQGGAKWEAIANPNWNLYVYRWSNNTEAEIYASTRDAVEQTLALEAYNNQKIVSGSEVWSQLTPWKATYWKSLKMGWKVKYRYTWEDEQLYVPPTPELEAWSEKIGRWHISYEEAVKSLN